MKSREPPSSLSTFGEKDQYVAGTKQDGIRHQIQRERYLGPITRLAVWMLLCVVLNIPVLGSPALRGVLEVYLNAQHIP